MILAVAIMLGLNFSVTKNLSKKYISDALLTRRCNYNCIC